MSPLCQTLYKYSMSLKVRTIAFSHYQINVYEFLNEFHTGLNKTHLHIATTLTISFLCTDGPGKVVTMHKGMTQTTTPSLSLL